MILSGGGAVPNRPSQSDPAGLVQFCPTSILPFYANVDRA